MDEQHRWPGVSSLPRGTGRPATRPSPVFVSRQVSPTPARGGGEAHRRADGSYSSKTRQPAANRTGQQITAGVRATAEWPAATAKQLDRSSVAIQCAHRRYTQRRAPSRLSWRRWHTGDDHLTIIERRILSPVSRKVNYTSPPDVSSPQSPTRMNKIGAKQCR